MASSAILDLLLAHWDHPHRLTEYLVICIILQNLVGSDALVYHGKLWKMEVLTFCVFGLKTPIHAPKLFFGGFDPLDINRYL